MGVLRRVRRKDGEARTWEWRLVSFLSYLCMRRKTQQATYSLFSLAKFLELLIYSPSLSSLDPSLCSHTASSKHDIVRHFAHSGWTLAFETSEVRDVYEVKVPKVRMLRGGTRGERVGMELGADDRVKVELRLQITKFWKGIKDHLDELVSLYKPLLPAFDKITFTGIIVPPATRSRQTKDHRPLS